MTDPTPSPAGAPAGPLGVGELAPVFALRNQYGETVSLEDFRGEKNVLVVFFPFAFSGVCTGEFRDHANQQISSLSSQCNRRSPFVGEATPIAQGSNGTNDPTSPFVSSGVT